MDISVLGWFIIAGQIGVAVISFFILLKQVRKTKKELVDNNQRIIQFGTMQNQFFKIKEEFTKAQNELQELRDKNKDLVEMQEKTTAKYSAKETEVKRKNQALSMLENEHIALVSRLKDLEAQFEKKEKELDRYKFQRAELNSLQDELQKLKAAFFNVSDDLQRQRKKNENLSQELFEQKNRLNPN